MAVNFQTCDLCDLYKSDSSGVLQVLPPVFRHFGGQFQFAGPVETVQCLEDNSRVKELLESPGEGRVLLVDGAASLKRALVGGNLAASAFKNQWAGIVVYGCVRDVQELQSTSIGIAAMALNPMPTDRKGAGVRGVSLNIEGVVVAPGYWLYADQDGVVVASKPVHLG